MRKSHTLIGIVLAGGRSTRMGQDKALINYHGTPQVLYMANLVQPFCESVLVSCRAGQAGNMPKGLNLLPDAEPYQNMGPVAALLTAFAQFPQASFLLLGCDYPLLAAGDIQKLVKTRQEGVDAVTYYNPETNIPEALLGIYENSCYTPLLSEAGKKNYSLRFFLQTIRSVLIAPDEVNSIRSIDTPEASKEIMAKLKTE